MERRHLTMQEDLDNITSNGAINEQLINTTGFSLEEARHEVELLVRDGDISLSVMDINRMDANELTKVLDTYSQPSETAPQKIKKLSLRDRFSLKVVNKFVSHVSSKAEKGVKAAKNWTASKEAFRNKEFTTSGKLAVAAIAGSIGYTTYLAIFSKSANAMGVSADVAHGLESLGHVGGGTFSLDHTGATSPTTPDQDYSAAFGTSPDSESLAREVQGTTPQSSVDSLVEDTERATGLDVADATTPDNFTLKSIPVIGGLVEKVEDFAKNINLDEMNKDALNEQHKDLTASRAELDGQLTTAEKEITRLEKQLADNTGNETIENIVKPQLSTLEQQVTDLTAQGKELDAQIADIDSKLDTAGEGSTETSGSTGEENADYNRNEQNSHDRMSTEGAFDGEDRGPKRLDDHVLAKIENNPALLAAVLEVRESGSMDGNFSLDDVNKDIKSFAVGGEHGAYSNKGTDALDTLKRSWDNGEQGKLLSKSEVNSLMEKYVFINHGVDAGQYENAIDNKMYDAGVFDYRPDLGDQIYAKELGNGKTAYFKVNELRPERDCLNCQTLAERPPVGTPIETVTTTPPTVTGGGSNIEITPNDTTGGGNDRDIDIDSEDETSGDHVDSTTDETTGGGGSQDDHRKNASEAPQGHDNGNNLAPAPTTVTPDSNANGVSGGSTVNPGATDPAPGAGAETNAGAPDAQAGSNTSGATAGPDVKGTPDKGQGNVVAVGDGS